MEGRVNLRFPEVTAVTWKIYRRTVHRVWFTSKGISNLIASLKWKPTNNLTRTVRYLWRKPQIVFTIKPDVLHTYSISVVFTVRKEDSYYLPWLYVYRTPVLISNLWCNWCYWSITSVKSIEPCGCEIMNCLSAWIVPNKWNLTSER